jgi:hypothetical protein
MTMNTYDNETPKAAPNANDFLGGNYLKKEDLSGPTTVTVTDVWSEAVLNAERRKLIVSFEEFEKPLILNKTNTRLLVKIFGTSDTASWRGQITLYVENDVEYGGRVVGGIRLHRARVVNGHAKRAEAGIKEVAASSGFDVEPL